MPEQPTTLNSGSASLHLLQILLDTLTKLWTLIFSVVQLPDREQAVFTKIAALIAAGAQVEYERQAELAQKDAELERIKAANEAQVGAISALEDKQIAVEQEFEKLNGILKWYLVNYPIIEGANARFKEQSVIDEQKFITSQADLEESIQENQSLRGRLNRLMTSLPSPTDTCLPRSTINQEATEENSRLKAELAATEAEKTIAITDKNKAESERDQAKSETEKLREDCERQANNLKTISTTLQTEISILRTRNEELVSTVNHLNSGIKDLEGANTAKVEKAKALVAKGEQMDQTKERLKSAETRAEKLEEELKNIKEEVKITLKNATTLSAENDSLLRSRDSRINEVEGQVDTLQQRNAHLDAENAEVLSAFTTMTQQMKGMRKDFTAAAEGWAKAEAGYKDSIEITHSELRARTEELEEYKKAWNHEREWHSCLQKYVNDLRVVLEGVMGELNVIGDLNNEQGVSQAGSALKDQIGASKSHYEQKLREIEYVKKQRDELQTFKTWAESALKTAGHHGDGSEALRKANEARRTLGEELVKVKSDNGNLRMRIEGLRKGLKSTKEESQGSQKNNETYTKRIQGLQEQLAGLQKKCDQLQDDVAKLSELKTKYEEEVQELQERKILLEKQRKDLVRSMYKPATGSSKSGLNPEKRSHEAADEAEEDQGSRSSKQPRPNFESESAE
ncbi:MAG: hypothetical protein Q9182_005768 [Xanthomendoza sp. 2 TL-2023]